MEDQYARTQPTTDGPLYSAQPNLPKLPVPDLKETCAKYLQTVRPLLDDVAYAKTQAIVEEFVKPGGIGEMLQTRLMEKDQATKKSWLIDWWNEIAYFGFRDPVVIYVSYFFQFVDDKRPQFVTQTGRAAGIVRAAMEFRRLLLW